MLSVVFLNIIQFGLKKKNRVEICTVSGYVLYGVLGYVLCLALGCVFCLVLGYVLYHILGYVLYREAPDNTQPQYSDKHTMFNLCLLKPGRNPTGSSVSNLVYWSAVL